MTGNIEAHYASTRHLNHEASLLDEGRYDEWLDTLAEDLDYRAPIHETKDNRSNEFSGDSFYFIDDKASLTTRVNKQTHQYSVSTNPPRHERRIVGNVMVGEERGDEFDVRSNLLLRISKTDQLQVGRLLTCERRDTLRRTDGELRLASREVLLDDTTADGNLDIFL